MKNFLKGFFLGFGLLFCVILGFIITRAYDHLSLMPKNLAYVRIKGDGIDAAAAQALSEKYSELLGRKCSIESINLEEISVPDSNTPAVAVNTKTEHNDTAAAAEAENPSENSIEQQEKSPSENLTETSATKTAVKPVAKQITKSFITLICERR